MRDSHETHPEQRNVLEVIFFLKNCFKSTDCDLSVQRTSDTVLFIISLRRSHRCSVMSGTISSSGRMSLKEFDVLIKNVLLIYLINFFFSLTVKH